MLCQMAERSWRLANALLDAGLQPGDRVATLLFNSAPMLEAHFAVPAAGVGVLVAINNRLGPAEVDYILHHSGARYLLARRRARAGAWPGLNLGGRDGDRSARPPAGRTTPMSSGWPRARARDAGPPACSDEEQTISINYTSGTTGRPKGVQVHLPRGIPQRAQRGDPGQG